MEGNKVMVVALKEVNPWQEKAICWPSGLEIPVERKRISFTYGL